jgi:hypothetical protein
MARPAAPKEVSADRAGPGTVLPDRTRPWTITCREKGGSENAVLQQEPSVDQGRHQHGEAGANDCEQQIRHRPILMFRSMPKARAPPSQSGGYRDQAATVQAARVASTRPSRTTRPSPVVPA